MDSNSTLTTENSNTDTPAPENTTPMEQSIKELLLTGLNTRPSHQEVMKRHLTPGDSTDTKCLDAAILVMRSPMEEKQQEILIPLLLGISTPESTEQGEAIQGFINAVESYLNMEHDSWDEFLGTGSRALMRRITTPIDKNLETLATEILGEESSTNRFAFDMLAHLGMDDEMNREEGNIHTPRELIALELDLRTKAEVKNVLSIFTCAPLGTPVEDMPIFDLLTEEWAEKQRNGVTIGVHIEPREEDVVTPEEIIADIQALAAQGESPTNTKEGENERAGGDNTPEDEKEEDTDEEGEAIITLPAQALKLREALEKIGEITLRAIAVNGHGYSIPTWNRIISQIPPEQMQPLAVFSQEVLGDSEALAQLTVNALHITWSNLLQAVELSEELSLPVAMAVMDWEEE